MTFIFGFITSAAVGLSIGIHFKSASIGSAAFVVVGLLYQILWTVSA